MDTVTDDRQQQSFSNNTYPELLYAHLLDADGSRLTYTHFTSRVPFRSLIDLSFNRPVFIQRNKVSGYWKKAKTLTLYGFFFP